MDLKIRCLYCDFLDTVRIMRCRVRWPITTFDGWIVVKSRGTVLCDGITVVTFIKLITVFMWVNSIRLIRTEKPIRRWFLGRFGCSSRCPCRRSCWWFSGITFGRCSCWLKYTMKGACEVGNHVIVICYLPLWSV